MDAPQFRQLFRQFIQQETQQADASLHIRLLEADRMMGELTDAQVETFAALLRKAFRRDFQDEILEMQPGYPR
ncbi:hypothetical protein KIKIMORA_00020 [Brevundimonas phage vB_BpoS-Kikimora]|uniref:Uncharacterized protein n=1 Tax=Brevundimonas phage vB_BpoS-Kikimora TaxID=2948601 RepID=A0A9E7MRL0_9CAUD|nr:hypothetical protein KIKIMORA_00020 [Brevundimonas phage vB_BpoS-Kikimora]